MVRRHNIVRNALAVLLALSGISAVAGGIGLVIAPNGSVMGYDLNWLDGSPFNDFLIPGLVLLIAVGGGQIIASAALKFDWSYSAELTFMAGAILFGWITIQVMIINQLSFLHFIYWAVSTIIMAASLLLWMETRSSSVRRYHL